MKYEAWKLIRKVEYPPLGQCPAEILESRLCQNTDTLQIALFLTIQNTSGKEITDIDADICCFDGEVHLLSTQRISAYKNIRVPSGAVFGENIPILLSSLRTASATATLRSITFADGSRWERHPADSTAPPKTAAPPMDKGADLLFSDSRRKRRLAEDMLWKEEKELTPEALQNKKKKRRIRLLAAAAVLICLLAAGLGIWRYTTFKNSGLIHGIELYHAENYEKAASALQTLDDRHFSRRNHDRLLWYRALSYIQIGNYSQALQDLYALDGRMDSSSCLRYLNGILSGLCGAGERHTVALKKDGTVLAAGDHSRNQCDIQNWTDMVAVAAGLNHTLGLKADGTVEAVGDDTYSQCALGSWKNVLAVAAGEKHSVGLLKNGRVITAGANDYGQCDTENWTGVVAIAAGRIHTVGLRQDGTVVAAGDNDMGACNVSHWKNIVAIAAGNGFTLGVQADGTVVAVGDNTYRECETDALSEIVGVGSGDFHALAITEKGRALGIGDNDWHQGETALWSNLIAVAGGVHHSIGICQEGGAYSAGDNKYGQCSITGWDHLGLPENAPAKAALVMQ